MSSNDGDDEILFLKDLDPSETEPLGEPWLVLIVDDDKSVHVATEFAFRDFRFVGRGIRFLNAYSAAEAKEVLICNPGIACVFLDVVMEYESAGLDLVEYIRDELKNAEIRLILRTGQPGYAPEISVIQDYDINDYKEKSFTTGEHLHTSVTAALRSYQQIMTIQENRRGLEMVIAASARLLTTHEVADFAAGILTQISALIHALPDGMVCVAARPQEHTVQVLAGAGRHAHHVRGVLDSESYPGLAEEVADVLRTRSSVFKQRVSLLYIPVTRLGEVVVVINTMTPIKELDRKLLELFSINIAVGFDNSFMYQKIENLAFVDQLTGLPNLFQLMRHMSESLDPAKAYVLGLADIDNFEAVNDGLGRDIGDYLIRHIGHELRQMPEVVFVARAGGDVFAFLLLVDERINIGDQLRAICSRLKKTLTIESSYVAVGVTIGATVFAGERVSASAAMGNAGVAMKNAKLSRQGSFLLFEDSMNAELRSRLHLTARMHKAIEDRSFFLLYQPQINLATGKVVGVEALIRWRDGNQIVPPDQFIAVAERSGLIIPLGKWVLEAALAQQKQWREIGIHIRMAVNVSTRQISEDEGFVGFVQQALQQYGGLPNDLELEVTETLLVSEMEAGVGRLRQLQQIGVQIAIDDFGTGYSSLGQLRNLPVNRLKIDKVFINGLDTDPDDFHIAEMIVRMGHAIKLSVLAEGVETPAQRDILEDLHCDEVQGYLYARPISPAELVPLFEKLGIEKTEM